MATLNREAIEQEIGKRFEKIEKTLERTLEKTLEKAIGKAAEFANSPAGTRAQAVAEKAQERMATARKSIDDVLLGLEHKGYNVKQPQDLINSVGRRVLERASEIADDVRTQVAAQPYSPEWLKTATAVAAEGVRTAATSVPAKTASAPVGATGATEGDGELAESKEDSAEERSAGSVVHSEPDVVTTSLAEASESDQASDIAASKPSKKTSKAAKTKK